MPDHMEMSMHQLGWGASIYYSQMQAHLTDNDRELLDTPRIYHVDQGLRKTEYTMEQVIASLITTLGTIPKEYGDGGCITFYHYVWSQLVDDNTYDMCLDLAGRCRVTVDHLLEVTLAQAVSTLLHSDRCGGHAINLYLVHSQMSGMDIAQVIHTAMQHSTEYIFILRTLGGRECIISPLLANTPKRHAFWSITPRPGIKGVELGGGATWYQFNTTTCTMQYTPLEEIERHGTGIKNEGSERNAVRGEVRIL